MKIFIVAALLVAAVSAKNVRITAVRDCGMIWSNFFCVIFISASNNYQYENIATILNMLEI